MPYYSFVAIAQQPVGFIKPLLVLDAGRNVFNAVVEDLEVFVDTLKAEGVLVKEWHRLDGHEENKPTDMLLEGESELPQLLGDFDEVET